MTSKSSLVNNINCYHYVIPVTERGHQFMVGDLRLNTEGSTRPFSGRLEIYYNDRWGTVCDDGFQGTEAYTACRQLGFIEAQHSGSVGSIG